MYTETFNVTVYANTATIEAQEITLSSGNSITVTFTWNTSGFARGSYTLEAIADTVFGERDIEDNDYIDGVVLVTIPGDVTGDMWVDMQDTSIIIDWFMTSRPEYDANCDVNDDLTIDMADISMAIGNFMTT
jgi:hypothetical protein